MLEVSRTTTVLLEGLRDPANAEAWAMFDRLYRPIVIGFARRLGLGESDSADVAQETMAQFVQEYRANRYDRSRGRLRTWLIALTKTRIAGLRRNAARYRDWRGDSAFIDLADDVHLTQIWDAERRTVVLRNALNILRERSRSSDTTIRAFELLALNQMPPLAVANELGISTHDVYLAKSRITQRLREIINSLDADFDEEPVINGAVGSRS
jgi:RNA polymerase sigma-70 factor (ECF subfamily)